MKTIKTGSDFSGVGAFDYAMKRVCNHNEFIHKRVYACDWDKYARITYEHNHGTPEYYPKDVYNRFIPEESLDIYMTSPPCQSFSIAGARKGKDSKNGVLFFNSHEFIKKNKPRFFIFENVKGLLSDDSGRTFQEWLNYLGGKSINGLPLLFKDENSVDYHIYWKVINSKKHGVPQNRERIFIVGIRDDADNSLPFPKEEHLILKLKHVLESEVDEKYFLSDKMINYISKNREGEDKLILNRDIANTITCEVKKMQRSIQDNYIWIADYRNDEGLRIRKDGIAPRMTLVRHSGINISTMPPLIGGAFIDNDSVIVHDIPEMVSVRKYEVDIKELQKTLKHHKNKTIKSISESLNVEKTKVDHWFRNDNFFAIPDPQLWNKLKKLLEIKTDEFDKSIMTFEEKEGIFEKSNRVYDAKGCAPTLTCVGAAERILTKSKIRRLTPRECFRLQDFPDSFDFSVVSDSQAYKQAGNSITVRVLELILNKLKL